MARTLAPRASRAKGFEPRWTRLIKPISAMTFCLSLMGRRWNSSARSTSEKKTTFLGDAAALLFPIGAVWFGHDRSDGMRYAGAGVSLRISPRDSRGWRHRQSVESEDEAIAASAPISRSQRHIASCHLKPPRRSYDEAALKIRKNIFWKQHFTVRRTISTNADPTSSTNPVEAASAVKSSAVGIQLGCNSSSFRSAEAYGDQWIIVGTIQATLPCDLETFRCRLIWLGLLALDKTEHKNRSPNRTFPRNGLFKVSVLDGPL
jgi:hypothetical protein